MNILSRLDQNRHGPEGFAVDADFVKDVFEKLRGALLHHVLDPQTGLQILQEPPQEPDEVLSRSDRTGNRL